MPVALLVVLLDVTSDELCRRHANGVLKSGDPGRLQRLLGSTPGVSLPVWAMATEPCAPPVVQCGGSPGRKQSDTIELARPGLPVHLTGRMRCRSEQVRPCGQ